ncbi:pyruvate dehydrogenase complex dihydrolipoamide acetyltransferase [Sphingomonas sp. ID0503]|uniref:pyruvate dehydrogenase complex dihydrolipoamide acetyltransferase n=1 Tax=Sphingomonas sp. ID0503 TaxID=3399691 RepID=UPI003AFA421B
MPVELKMPALSPTMEEGTLSKWLVKEGDTVASGDVLAEIETDKATMEFEAVDEGVVAKILVPAGTEGVKVGAPIAIIAEEGEDASAAASSEPKKTEAKADVKEEKAEAPKSEVSKQEAPAAKAEAKPAPAPASAADDRVKASPLARRLAEQSGIDLAGISGSGPNGRIVKADLDGAKPATKPAAAKSETSPESAKAAPAAAPEKAAAPSGLAPETADVPAEAIKLSGMRKTIARRLTESKQTVPHIYLTVDIRLDALLKLRGELNKGLEARGVKLSVNDLLIKAQAAALMEVPTCNVQFAGDTLFKFGRADISVAVSIEGGLITPIIRDANNKGVARISTEMKDLADRAKAGKLKPEEYQGGTASISNMGMFGIKNFDAVINPPQAMILAIGAGEKRPYVVNDELTIATIMSATGSFDHRAIDGADGAAFMAAFKRLVENPLGMLA